MAKPIHIVFQVLNFIQSHDSDYLNLSDDEQLLLLTLARIKGKDGICPSVITLAKRRKKHFTSIHRTLRKLEKKLIIKSVKYNGKVSHYELNIPQKQKVTPSVHAMSDTPSVDAIPPLALVQVTPSVDAIRYNTYKLEHNRERVSAEPKSLSLETFKPNGTSQSYCQNHGLNFDYELSRFRSYAKNEQRKKNPKWNNDNIAYQWGDWLQRAAQRCIDKNN